MSFDFHFLQLSISQTPSQDMEYSKLVRSLIVCWIRDEGINREFVPRSLGTPGLSRGRLPVDVPFSLKYHSFVGHHLQFSHFNEKCHLDRLARVIMRKHLLPSAMTAKGYIEGGGW